MEFANHKCHFCSEDDQIIYERAHVRKMLMRRKAQLQKLLAKNGSMAQAEIDRWMREITDIKEYILEIEDVPAVRRLLKFNRDYSSTNQKLMRELSRN